MSREGIALGVGLAEMTAALAEARADSEARQAPAED